VPGVVGVWASLPERVKVEVSPLVVGVETVPTVLPPEQAVPGEFSWHSVKVTVPVGAPPVELPVTVAESFHELPTAVEDGDVRLVVNAVGMIAVTVKHSVSD